MAKYHGTFRCGCAGTVNVVGKTSERQRNADWQFENHVCPECYAKEREAKQAEDDARAAAKAVELADRLQLQPLRGTEKQVVWATEIRAKILEDFEKNVRPRLKKESQIEASQWKQMQDTINVFILNPSAGFWIDNRDKDAVTIFHEVWAKIEADYELGTLKKEREETLEDSEFNLR
jgi:hypothetical protein